MKRQIKECCLGTVGYRLFRLSSHDPVGYIQVTVGPE